MSQEKQEKIMKPLKDLTLLDRFLFDVSMEDPVIFQNVLGIILGKEVKLMSPVETEKEFRTSPLLRSIRVDVYSMDERKKIYNAEAQKENIGNLPKRSRYYQALIDSSLLEPGVINFNLLNDVYIIMICPFDLFHYKKYRYTFDMKCREVEELSLGDGVVRIFLNTRGENDNEVTPELAELLHYIEHTNTMQEESICSEKVREIKRRVDKIKSSEEMGVQYMQAWEEKVYERMAGQEEGRAEEKAKEIHLIRSKLKKNLSPVEISDWMEISEEYVRFIEALCRKAPDMTDEEIALECLKLEKEK